MAFCSPSGSLAKDLNLTSLASQRISAGKIDTCGTLTAGTIVVPLSGGGSITIGPSGIFITNAAGDIISVVGNGSIQMFSSGLPVVLTTVAGGLVGNVTALGTGSAAVPVANASLPGVINLTLNPTLAGFTYDVPRAGTLNSLVSSFLLTVGIALPGTDVVVNTTLYRSPAGNGVVFESLAPLGGSVNLSPAFSGVLGAGAFSTGATATGSFNVAVAKGDRLLGITSITASGVTLITALTGLPSYSFTIE